MTRTLFRKELIQHWPAFLLLFLLTMMGYGLIVIGVVARGDAGSVFETLRGFVGLIVVLAGLVLCHRLVVVEYAAKTQLFLEALPVARWRMVAVKYVLGLMLMLTIVAFAITVACLLGQQRESLSPRFISILTIRAMSVTILAYHFFFLMGFLGRYRLALYIIMIIAAAALGEMSDIEIKHFGPFALLDGRFAFENQYYPWDALTSTWVMSAIFLLIAFALALVREGGVASLLAEKMSHREKVVIAATIIGIIFAFGVLKDKKQRPPFDLHDAVTETRDGLVVKTATSSDSLSADAEDDARAIARHVANQISAAQEFLGIKELPPVFITPRRDLDPLKYERGELTEASGVHVQANFSAAGFRRNEFASWLLRETLITHTEGRSKLESKMWVLDGFALYAQTQDHAEAALPQDKAYALRALYGAELGFSWQDLDRWHSFRERVGDDIAAGVAWSGLKTLARHVGPDRTRQFIRATLGAEVPKDARALLHEWKTPMARLLAQEAGLKPEDFWKAWQEELAQARQELAADLARLPRLTGEMKFAKLSSDSRTSNYRVSIEPPPSAGTQYSLVYCELPVFDQEVEPQLLFRERNVYPTRAHGELPNSLERGARIYWTFELDVPELGCTVVSGWKREEIR